MKSLTIVLTILALGSPAFADPFTAVISVDPAREGSCIAVELDLSDGQALAGLRWFHNDGEQVFPRVVLVEGTAGRAPDLGTPAIVLAEVPGVSLDWGELTLAAPVTSSTSTAFAVFFYPESVGTEGLGQGGGPGIGLRPHAGANRPFYLSADATHFVRFDPTYQLAVEPITVLARGTAPTIADVGIAIDRPGGTKGEVLSDPDAEAWDTALHAAQPNPFNPRVTLSFTLASAGEVQLQVFDVRGRVVRTLVNEVRSTGPHTVVWTGQDAHARAVSSGVYFVRLQAGGVVRTQRIVLVR